MKFIEAVRKHAHWVLSGIGLTLYQSFNDFFRKNEFTVLSSTLVVVAVIFISVILIELFVFLKNREIRLFVKDKLVEILHFLLGNKTFTIKGTKNFDCYTHYDNFLNILDLIKSAVCKNQGLFIDYQYTGGKYHSAVKEELYGATCINKKKLKKTIEELGDYLGDYLDDVISLNYQYMEGYFQGRSEIQPRITVKAYRDDKIVDVYRKGSEYFSKYHLDQNTGFKQVYESGSYYICNNIPREVEKGRYINPRLDNKKVLDYLKLKDITKELDEQRWIDCWVGNHLEKDDQIIRATEESCYRSTLIVPMTLINNDGVSLDFKRHFEIPSPSGSRVGRAVYGFLCFDHREKDYFDAQIDCKFGYIFADILSLYFIEILNYTTFSKTFNEAYSHLSGLGISLLEENCNA